MRERNLFDTETAPPKLTPPDGGVLGHRAADGSFNGAGHAVDGNGRRAVRTQCADQR